MNAQTFKMQQLHSVVPSEILLLFEFEIKGFLFVLYLLLPSLWISIQRLIIYSKLNKVEIFIDILESYLKKLKAQTL